MEYISLVELQKQIKAGIESRHEAAYWVSAEINEIKVNSAGHCYIELIHKSDDTDFMEAKISAVIWSKMFRLLKSYFETSTGKSLCQGIKILVKAYVQYHELYGLSLNITDIDPTYTVGDLELQRQKIISQLKEEGIYNMNRELEFPVLPNRIAVISSKQAAGYQDFMQQLTNNDYKYSFNVQFFSASMQGKDAEKTIVAALDKIYTSVKNFDLVVIIRGGGSQADLSCFDSYRLAYHVAQFPIPVITGIGHDKDISITDMVAHHMLKTPTAVAAFLINSMYEQESQLNELAYRLTDIVQLATNKEENLLKLYLSRLQSVNKTNMDRERNKINTWIPKQLRSVTNFLLREQRQKISQTLTKLDALNPQIILKRGYSLTLHKGKPLKSISLIKDDYEVETVLADGKFISKIKQITKHDGK